MKIATILVKIFGRKSKKKGKKIKQNLAGQENFDICFYIVFDLYYQSFSFGRQTGN